MKSLTYSCSETLASLQGLPRMVCFARDGATSAAQVIEGLQETTAHDRLLDGVARFFLRSFLEGRVIAACQMYAFVGDGDDLREPFIVVGGELCQSVLALVNDAEVHVRLSPDKDATLEGDAVVAGESDIDPLRRGDLSLVAHLLYDGWHKADDLLHELRR